VRRVRALDADDELLPQAFAFAERLGTRNITVFALPKPADTPQAAPPPVVIDTLAAAGEKARAEGFVLLVENGGGTWADTAEATRAVLSAVGSDAIKLVWDPANAAHADPDVNPVEQGYPLIRQYVGGLHVKDLVITEGGPAWSMLGDGLIDWPEQLRLLQADGYDGLCTVESHLQYRPGADLNLVASMEQYLQRLRELLGA